MVSSTYTVSPLVKSALEKCKQIEQLLQTINVVLDQQTQLEQEQQAELAAMELALSAVGTEPVGSEPVALASTPVPSTPVARTPVVDSDGKENLTSPETIANSPLVAASQELRCKSKSDSPSSSSSSESESTESIEFTDPPLLEAQDPRNYSDGESETEFNLVTAPSRSKAKVLVKKDASNVASSSSSNVASSSSSFAVPRPLSNRNGNGNANRSIGAVSRTIGGRRPAYNWRVGHRNHLNAAVVEYLRPRMNQHIQDYLNGLVQPGDRDYELTLQMEPHMARRLKPMFYMGYYGGPTRKDPNAVWITLYPRGHVMYPYSPKALVKNFFTLVPRYAQQEPAIGDAISEVGLDLEAPFYNANGVETNDQGYVQLYFGMTEKEFMKKYRIQPHNEHKYKMEHFNEQ